MSATGNRTAAAYWAEALAGWAIPDEITDGAPEAEPWRFSPATFAWTAARAAAEGPIVTPSRRRALEALAGGGTVLDVGAGGGRASLPLAPPAALVVAVDSSEELLAAFTEAADREGVPHRTVHGAWPEVADRIAPQDVVVCHNVLYNIPEVPPFLEALTSHARRRVVLELTADHPTSNLNEAWRVLHGLTRPTRPTADDALAVLDEMGLSFESEEWERRVLAASQDRSEVVASVRRRLCVGPERDAEIDALLPLDFATPARRVVTVWWDGAAGQAV